MKTYRTMRTALRALRRNPMLAALTTLGIIIGVGAVIAMMEIGAGSSAAIQKTIASMGANSLMIHPGTASSSGVSFGSGSIMTLTPDDCEAVIKECTAVKTAAPVVRTRTQIVCGDRNWVPTFIYMVPRRPISMSGNGMYPPTASFSPIWMYSTAARSASSARLSFGNCSTDDLPSARKSDSIMSPCELSVSSNRRAPT